MLLQATNRVEHRAPACSAGWSARVIEAGDRERRRLERDLHDGASSGSCRSRCS